MHRRLGSATLSQLAFPGEGHPNFPWETNHWGKNSCKKFCFFKVEATRLQSKLYRTRSDRQRTANFIVTTDLPSVVKPGERKDEKTPRHSYEAWMRASTQSATCGWSGQTSERSDNSACGPDGEQVEQRYQSAASLHSDTTAARATACETE